MSTRRAFVRLLSCLPVVGSLFKADDLGGGIEVAAKSATGDFSAPIGNPIRTSMTIRTTGHDGIKAGWWVCDDYKPGQVNTYEYHAENPDPRQWPDTYMDW